MNRTRILTATMTACLAMVLCFGAGCDEKKTASSARSTARTASKAYDQSRAGAKEATKQGKIWSGSFADEWKKIHNKKP